jgi:uncharacterized protein YbcI
MPASPDGMQQNGSGETSAALANAVVHLVREYTGRGPTRAKAYLNHDLATVVLQDTLTTGERRLVDHGKIADVLRTRHLFQEAMGKDLIKAVERVTSRTVLAFLSANHVEPDIAIESFLLEPQPEPAV